MKLSKHSTRLLATSFLLTSLGFSPVSIADDRQDSDDEKSVQFEPIELLINFQIAGNFTSVTSAGEAVYTIGGPGFAPDRISRKTGEISDVLDPERNVASLAGAQITFGGDPFAPVVKFGCIAGSCNMTFKDGSVLTSDAGVPLEGRAINMWGPVINSPSFDPVNGIVPIRILGCGGLKGLPGKGRFAGMVGSICFNGQLNFNVNDQTVLSGSSKCTIALHTPAPGVVIP